MKKVFTITALLFASVLLTECTPKKTATKEITPEEKVADVKKNFTPAQMEEGKAIWQTSCNKCHKLYSPDTRNVQSWEKILPVMSGKAKLTAEHAAMVRAYVLSNAKQG
jgi:cytochrome c5